MTDAQVLHAQIRKILKEDLSDEQLTSIWPSIETEWVRQFPNSKGLLTWLTQRTGALRSTRLALETLSNTMDKYVASEKRAGVHDAERERIEGLTRDFKSKKT